MTLTTIPISGIQHEATALQLAVVLSGCHVRSWAAYTVPDVAWQYALCNSIKGPVCPQITFYFAVDTGWPSP